MTTTDRDVASYVRTYLAGDDENYDVNAIVVELVQNYDLTSDSPTQTLDDIPSVEFYDLVRAHAVSGRRIESDWA